MGEIENIGVADGLHDIRHRRVVAASRIALVLAQRLHEVVLALAAKRGTFCSPEKSWLWQKLHRCCWISARARRAGQDSPVRRRAWAAAAAQSHSPCRANHR